MIPVRHLFKPLDEELIKFLNSLSDQEWEAPTSAGNWTVKDVASHLLDGNLRALSIQRDRFFGENPPGSNEYRDLVTWLNDLNRDWVKATRRLSPQVLCLLLEFTGPHVTNYYNSLDLNKKALFPVDWAGENESLNWMHLAREYTEKWHHQQQIREVRNDNLLLSDPFFTPYVRTSLTGLPYLFRNITRETGTTVCLKIQGECDVSAYLIRENDQWVITQQHTGSPASIVSIPAALCWKLFSGNIRNEQVQDKVGITGDRELGARVLDLVAVMA